MVLFIIGLGLGDEKDITVRGLEAVKSCDKIFLEAYTSILRVDKERLESFYDKSISIADRHKVESEAEQIIEPAKDQNVALLVVGDPVCATTHTDIIIRAQEIGVQVELIHNASAMGAVGCCGLQVCLIDTFFFIHTLIITSIFTCFLQTFKLYNFGRTVSIPFFEHNWRPTSFYEKIQYNKDGGMHTLCLLDIKVKEPDFEAMARGKTVYLPPRYMTVNTAAEQLLEAEQEHQKGVCTSDCLAVGLARLGQPDQCILAGTLQELTTQHFGEPLHSLIICGDVHELEFEMLRKFMVPSTKYRFSEKES